jgi:hypothetical protein
MDADAAPIETEEPICRICWEPQNLLTDVCACRGSVGSIHSKCLKQLVAYEQTCSICLDPYKVRVLNPYMHGAPLFWRLLSSESFDCGVYLAMFVLFRIMHYSVILNAQIAVAILHTLAYAPLVVRWATDPQYGRAWMRMWLRCMFCTYTNEDPDVKTLVAPFPAVIMYCIGPFIPGWNLLFDTNKRLWKTHVHIVAVMAAMED